MTMPHTTPSLSAAVWRRPRLCHIQHLGPLQRQGLLRRRLWTWCLLRRRRARPPITPAVRARPSCPLNHHTNIITAAVVHCRRDSVHSGATVDTMVNGEEAATWEAYPVCVVAATTWLFASPRALAYWAYEAAVATWQRRQRLLREAGGGGGDGGGGGGDEGGQGSDGEGGGGCRVGGDGGGGSTARRLTWCWRRVRSRWSVRSGARPVPRPDRDAAGDRPASSTGVAVDAGAAAAAAAGVGGGLGARPQAVARSDSLASTSALMTGESGSDRPVAPSIISGRGAVGLVVDDVVAAVVARHGFADVPAAAAAAGPMPGVAQRGV